MQHKGSPNETTVNHKNMDTNETIRDAMRFCKEHDFGHLEAAIVMYVCQLIGDKKLSDEDKARAFMASLMSIKTQ